MEENKKISNILSNPWVSFSIGTAVGVIGVKGAEYAKKKIDEYARNIAEEHLRAQARYLAEELRKDNVSSVSEKIYQEDASRGRTVAAELRLALKASKEE